MTDVGMLVAEMVMVVVGTMAGTQMSATLVVQAVLLMVAAMGMVVMRMLGVGRLVVENGGGGGGSGGSE
jgi:Na+(H+)/acetate symporter ActP